MLLKGKFLRWMIMLCAAVLATGCAGNGSYCELTRPIWWASDAELVATPDGIVRQVVTHNEKWRSVCK